MPKKVVVKPAGGYVVPYDQVDEFEQEYTLFTTSMHVEQVFETPTAEEVEQAEEPEEVVEPVDEDSEMSKQVKQTILNVLTFNIKEAHMFTPYENITDESIVKRVCDMLKISRETIISILMDYKEGAEMLLDPIICGAVQQKIIDTLYGNLDATMDELHRAIIADDELPVITKENVRRLLTEMQLFLPSEMCE